MPRSKSTDLAVHEAEAAVEAIEASTQAIAPYLDGKAYQPERLIEEIEFFHKQHVATGFEVGKRLVALKANIPRGEFTAHVLERVRISPQHASHLMAFARTVIEASALSKGQLDFDKLQAMDTRKVVLLGEVVAENADELEERGTIGGRTLDEWDAMSRDELKRTIRQQQEHIEEGRIQLNVAKDKLLTEKEKTESVLAADPNAVSMSVTRVGNLLRDALTDFTRTAVLDDGDLPEATALDVVTLRANLRQFHDLMNRLIDERFPEIHEVPTDIDTTGAPNLLHKPMPTKGTANIIDAK